MSYQSLGFIAFSIAALILYYLGGKKLQLWVLAAANLTFYAVAGLKYLPFLLVTMLATFFTGLAISGIYNKADLALAECTELPQKKAIRADAKKKAKRMLGIALFVSIALLAVCKYTGFVMTNVNSVLTGLGKQPLEIMKIILPLGISFYTFMAISYVLDIYWKRYKAEKNFLLYAVYLSYFPHVVQGPIDRFNEFKEQVSGGIAFKYENVTQGAQLALWGFFKKLVIADRLGMLVGGVIDNWKDYTGVWIAIAIITYSIQIYADFSGCIDIVTGVSEMFGISIRKNFNHPYFSKTMGEFWRRWHISLQEWFKDYIYYPVSASELTKSVKKHFKKRNNKRAEELFASCFPVLVVWLITGIWHGASWTFVLWGLFHATLLIGGQVLEPVFKKTTDLLHIDTTNYGWGFLQMVRTFTLCCIGRVFFRASTIMESFALFKRMLFDFDFPSLFKAGLVEKLGFGAENMVISLLAVATLWVVDLLQERMPLRKTLAKQNLVFRWVILFVGLFAVIIFGIYGPGYTASSFIYEQF